jgi:phosphoglycerate dehydrogenase-like enzyme
VAGTALLTLRLDDPWQDRLERMLGEAGFRVVRTEHGTRDWTRSVPEAQVAILSGAAFPELVDAPQLQWIHCGQAGADSFLPTSLFATGKRITTAAGRSRASMAEHALAMMMALAHDHAGVRHLRAWRQWLAPSPLRRRALWGRTVGIVGVGNTGGTLAAYCAALGMRVLAWRRSDAPHPPGVHRGFSAEAGDSLLEMLPQCELLVLACPLSNRTVGMIGEREIAALPRGAFLINVARGRLLDEPALLAALRSGHLAGAGLDVVAREPLRPLHPFWRMRNVILSAHTPPRQSDREERHLAQIAENVRRFRAGEPLANELTVEDAYDPVGLDAPLGILERAVGKAMRVGFRLTH